MRGLWRLTAMLAFRETVKDQDEFEMRRARWYAIRYALDAIFPTFIAVVGAFRWQTASGVVKLGTVMCAVVAVIFAVCAICNYLNYREYK